MQDGKEVADQDHDAVEHAQALAPREIYEVIRREGEEELTRSFRSLLWSGIAAGLLISLSVLGEAIFRTYLPDRPSSFLIENLGYALGFLAVIMARMQLFTENTITTVLPVVHQRSWACLVLMLRLWAIVLGANVIGAFCAAGLFVLTPALPVNLMPAIIELSAHATGMGAEAGFWRAIPAGIIVALIVWMIPQAEAAAFFLVITFTWLIAAGDFTHIVAGSVEMAILLLRGELGAASAVFEFFLPVLAGNIIGGTLIFTLVAWSQVRDEIEDDSSAG